MIYCPKCGKHTSVLETRAQDTLARRRRACPNGHQIHTEERIVKTVRSVTALMSDRDQSEAKRGIPRA